MNWCAVCSRAIKKRFWNNTQRAINYGNCSRRCRYKWVSPNVILPFKCERGLQFIILLFASSFQSIHHSQKLAFMIYSTWNFSHWASIDCANVSRVSVALAHSLLQKCLFSAFIRNFFPASLSDLFASNLFGGKHLGWIEAFLFCLLYFRCARYKIRKKNRCDVVYDSMQSYSIIVCLSCYHYLEVSPT